MKKRTQLPDRLKHVLKYSKQRELSAGSVYFVQCNDLVKIGFAIDVAGRMNQMQTGNPYKLVLLAAIPSLTPDVLEDELHSSVEQYRVRGEWFNIPPDVLPAPARRQGTMSGHPGWSFGEPPHRPE